MTYAVAAVQALVSHSVGVAGANVYIPGSTAIRLSTVLGNRRIHRLMTPFLTPGAVVVDVGANIGVNTVFAAMRVGPSGRVFAIEPADDNLAILRDNLRRNALTNVTVAAVAAGPRTETRSLYLRGDVSAVNSFYAESVYSTVTDVVTVPVAPLDDLVAGEADLVKIDVEGAELEVLEGMTRLLASRHLTLVVEWHPLLQEKAGYAPDALPRWLLQRGYRLMGATHTSVKPLTVEAVPDAVHTLTRSGRPIDILATRS